MQPRPKSSDLRPAIAQLKINYDTMRTNEPGNRKRGDITQAALEKANGASYKAAMGVLHRYGAVN